MNSENNDKLNNTQHKKGYPGFDADYEFNKAIGQLFLLREAFFAFSDGAKINELDEDSLEGFEFILADSLGTLMEVKQELLKEIS